jgi:hypothetical protein
MSNGLPVAQDHGPNSSLKNAKVRHIGKQASRLHLNSAMRNEGIRNTKEVLTRACQRLERIEKTGATFFLTDLDMGMTLTRIASDASKDSEKRSRNQANARHAYDEVSRMSRGAVLSDNERNDVDEKLAELRSALQQAKSLPRGREVC